MLIYHSDSCIKEYGLYTVAPKIITTFVSIFKNMGMDKMNINDFLQQVSLFRLLNADEIELLCLYASGST
jgi:hypothetical protein